MAQLIIEINHSGLLSAKCEQEVWEPKPGVGARRLAVFFLRWVIYARLPLDLQIATRAPTEEGSLADKIYWSISKNRQTESLSRQICNSLLSIQRTHNRIEYPLITPLEGEPRRLPFSVEVHDLEGLIDDTEGLEVKLKQLEQNIGLEESFSEWSPAKAHSNHGGHESLAELVARAKTRLVVSGHTLDKFTTDDSVVEAIRHALDRGVFVTFIMLNPASPHADAHEPYHQLESRCSAQIQYSKSLERFQSIFQGQSERNSVPVKFEVLLSNYMPHYRSIFIDAKSVHISLYTYGWDLEPASDIRLNSTSADSDGKLFSRITRSLEDLLNAPELVPFIKNGVVYNRWRDSHLANWHNWSAETRLNQKMIHNFYVNVAGEFHERYGDPSTIETEVMRCLDALDPSGSTLVLGCGSGREVKYLSERGFPEIVGVDFSPKAIEYARSKHPHLMSSFRVEDFYDVALHYRPGSVTNVVANAALVHLYKREEITHILDSIFKILCPGGCFFVRGLYKEEDGKPVSQGADNHFPVVRGGRTEHEWRWFVYYSRKELVERCRKAGFLVEEGLHDVLADHVQEAGYECGTICEKGFPHLTAPGTFWPIVLATKPKDFQL